MKSRIFALILTLITLLPSCKKHCDPIEDPDMLSWVNFDKYDFAQVYSTVTNSYFERIRFVNQYQDTLDFDPLFIKSESTDEPLEGGDCSAWAFNHGQRTDTVLVDTSMIKFTSGFVLSLDIFRNNTHLCACFINLPIGTVSNEQLDFYAKDLDKEANEYEINGKIYESAVVIENDPESCTGEVYRCVIAKGYGIIQFTLKDGTVWSLVN